MIDKCEYKAYFSVPRILFYGFFFAAGAAVLVWPGIERGLVYNAWLFIFPFSIIRYLVFAISLYLFADNFMCLISAILKKPALEINKSRIILRGMFKVDILISSIRGINPAGVGGNIYIICDKNKKFRFPTKICVNSGDVLDHMLKLKSYIGK